MSPMSLYASKSLNFPLYWMSSATVTMVLPSGKLSFTFFQLSKRGTTNLRMMASCPGSPQTSTTHFPLVALKGQREGSPELVISSTNMGPPAKTLKNPKERKEIMRRDLTKRCILMVHHFFDERDKITIRNGPRWGLNDIDFAFAQRFFRNTLEKTTVATSIDHFFCLPSCSTHSKTPVPPPANDRSKTIFRKFA